LEGCRASVFVQYLGADLEDVHGRTIHEDDSCITLPVLSMSGVVLLPGQMLPLFLFQPSTVAMIKQVLERDRTFAYVAPRSAPFLFNVALVHCNLVITLILGAKHNERYNGTSVIMKCTFWMAWYSGLEHDVRQS